MKRKRLLWSVAAAVCLGVALFVYHIQPPTMSAQEPTTTTVTVGRTVIAVEVADTLAAREQGLSGRAGLAPNSGMLFVFEQPGNWGFWMKDMRFALDIIYADAAGTIVTIHPNLAPSTYPQAFYPSAPAKYVLEVPAGYAAAHGIATGQKIVVQYAQRVE